MGNTYTWQDGVNLVGQTYPRLMSVQNGAMIVDQTQSFIWGYADWRFSLVPMSPFFLVPGQQDYGPPNVPIPTDFLGIRKADLVYNITQPPFHYPPLVVDRVLYPTAWQGRPEAICWEPTTSVFRVFPRIPLGIGPTDYQIELTYKKLPVKVSASTMGQTMPWDDIYFGVYCEGLRWQYLQSQPGVPLNDKQAQYVVFMQQLDHMAANESLNLGNDGEHPNEAWADW